MDSAFIAERVSTSVIPTPIGEIAGDATGAWTFLRGAFESRRPCPLARRASFGRSCLRTNEIPSARRAAAA